MIRVLHVVNSLNINAGMMSVVMNYYRHINRDRVQFDFMYFTETSENHKEEISKLGGRIFTLGKPSFGIKYQKQLNLFFEQHKEEYIAVHCHPIWAAEFFSNAAKKNGIKHIIAHSHSTKFSDKKVSSIRNRIMVSIIGLFATDYIACSPEAAYLFGKRRVNNGHVKILRNAIECKKFKYNEIERKRIRSEFGIDDKTLVIGNIGRFCIQKNQEFLLKVFKEILEIEPYAKMMIVGDGELRTKLETKIIELDIADSVILTGKRRDVNSTLSCMDVFVMPSLFEGAPVAAIEAQTAGLPCIMSDTITKSVGLSSTKYLSLTLSSQVWAEEVISIWKEKHLNNRNNSQEVTDAGFDIDKEAINLEYYYLSLS